MKHIQYSLLSLLLICIITACSKNTPEPPEPPEPPEEPMLTEATMEGKHTLSFLLDGEVWVSDRGWLGLSSSIALSSKWFAVSAHRNELEDGISFQFGLEDFTPNLYEFDKEQLHLLFTRSQAINNCAYNFRNIEKDTFNKVDILWIDNKNLHIAGTFQYRMIDQIEGCIDTSYITDGRFDLQFQTKP